MGCCTGSTFTPAPDAALDPMQRVNYTFGMVLGVDDFRQEQTYLMARDDRLLRELVGYGTLRGLTVTLQGDQVRVSPGMALMPDGRLVAVPAEQCADVARWRETELAATPGTGGDQTIYVRLFAADASGSPVPIPGEPCRDESELSADARIADSFRLDFSFAAPDASEDLALRAVVAWLRAIKVGPNGVTLEEFCDTVRAQLAQVIATTWSDVHAPVPQPPVLGLPGTLPAPPADLRIPRAQLAEYYAAAFDVWVQLVRTAQMTHHGPVPVAQALPEHGLLLAALEVQAGKAKVVHMLGRQQLLHQRLLQEWLLRDGSQDAPREAHFVLGKGDPELDHAQDLQADFAEHNQAMTRIDIVGDNTDGALPGATKAKIVPAVKWPGGGDGGGPDYYGPGMTQPIPVADGGTGQNLPPQTGALLVGRGASDETGQAQFELGSLVGAPLTKPVGPSSNILVDLALSPQIRLDTVQDIGPQAHPTFAALDVTGMLTVDHLVVDTEVDVHGGLSVTGEVTLGAPVSSVLATDAQGVVGAARVWDGDESALTQEPPTPYLYAPGQGDGESGAAVRVVDGGTGLTRRPQRRQVLVGADPEVTGVQGGDYVLATLKSGANIDIRLEPDEGEDWQIVIDAAAVAPTQVVATGSPPSLTASMDGNVAFIDTAQALHSKARPEFAGLSLTNLEVEPAPDGLLGWREKDQQVVLTRGGGSTDITRWPVRYIRQREELFYKDGDMVLVVLVSGGLKLPSPKETGIGDGRVLVVTSATEKFSLDGIGSATDSTSPSAMPLGIGQSCTLISALELPVPGWLVIGRG